MSAYEQFNQTLADWDQLQRLRVGMERYADALSGRTEVTGDVAEAIAISLESIDPDFDIREGSKITLRALKEGIVAASKAAAEIIAYLWNTLKALYIKFTGSIKQVRRHQEGISKRLGRLGSKTTYKKMSVAGVQRLSLDGEFVGTDVSHLINIKETTDYILTKYPKSVIKISRDCSRHFLNIVEQNPGANQIEVGNAVVNKFVEILQQDFRAPPGHRPVSAKEMPTAEKGVHRGEILPGNVAFVFTPPDTVQSLLANQRSNQLDPEAVLNNAFVMQFAELQLNVADKSEREVDVPPVADLKELSDVISNILTLAERGEDGIRDFATVKTVVDDAIRQIADKAEKTGEPTSGNIILHITGVISKKLAEPMGYYTHWLAVTLNVYLTFIGHCIAHYETEGI